MSESAREEFERLRAEVLADVDRQIERNASRHRVPDKPDKTAFSAASRGTGQCPVCGSTAIKAKRSLKGKVAAGLLAPKTRVKCQGCGTTYLRG